MNTYFERFQRRLRGVLVLALVLAYSQPTTAAVELRFISPPQQLTQALLSQKIEQWLQAHPGPSPDPDLLALYLRDYYLQRGNPNVDITVTSEPTLLVEINENSDMGSVLDEIRVIGGTPQQRFIVNSALRHQTAQPYSHSHLQEDMTWIKRNHGLPISLILRSTLKGHITAMLYVESLGGILPIANAALTDLGGLSLTAGAVLNNFFNDGNNYGLAFKKNNLRWFGDPTPALMQDWEYIATFETENMPVPGMVLGVNHYNKQDYIFEDFRRKVGDYFWVRSLGLDIYSGIQLWSNPQSRQYLRAILNISMLQDQAYSNRDNLTNTLMPRPDGSGYYALPSLNLSYSNLDNYIFPQNGHFIRGQVRGGVGDRQYAQLIGRADSFFTPLKDAHWQLTLFFQNVAGTTLGDSPFYRGMLNNGGFFVRGATQYSTVERNGLKFTQEARLFFRPTPLEVDRLAAFVTGNPEAQWPFLHHWGAFINLFLDEGSYWNQQLTVDRWQVGTGMGLNILTPGGLVASAQYTLPLYPRQTTGTLYLTLSAPFSFFLYTDRVNSNGFFLR